MKEGSMIEKAIEVLQQHQEAMRFVDLWREVKLALDIRPEEEESRIGHFYTDISLNGQFVVLPDGTWDLRARHTYDKVHIDVKYVYSDVEEDSGQDAEDIEDEKEYNQSVLGSLADEDEEEVDEDEEKPISENAAELLGLKEGDY